MTQRIKVLMFNLEAKSDLLKAIKVFFEEILFSAFLVRFIYFESFFAATINGFKYMKRMKRDFEKTLLAKASLGSTNLLVLEFFISGTRVKYFLSKFFSLTEKRERLFCTLHQFLQ